MVQHNLSLPIAPLCPGSDIKVYQADITFFLDKIKSGESFTFSRQLHGFWDGIIGALIIDPSLRQIRIDDDDYLLKLARRIHYAKKAMHKFRYNERIYFDVLKMITNLHLKPSNFYFGISDMAFYPQDEPPYKVNSYPNYPLFKFLPGNSPLKHFPLKIADRQTIIKYFLPDNYVPFNGIVWRKFGYHDLLQDFFKQLEDFRIVVVGPAYYNDLNKVINLPDYHHIQIPFREAADHHFEIRDQIIQLHQSFEDSKPTIYFIVAGTVGTWLAIELHDKLERAVVLDIGMALDPLFKAKDNPNIVTSHFFKKEPGKKHYTERPGFFSNEDLGTSLEIGDDGQVTFHFKPKGFLNRTISIYKTRLLFLYLSLKYGARRWRNKIKAAFKI